MKRLRPMDRRSLLALSCHRPARCQMVRRRDDEQAATTDLAATARWLESKYGFVSNLAQTMAHSRAR